MISKLRFGEDFESTKVYCSQNSPEATTLQTLVTPISGQQGPFFTTTLVNAIKEGIAEVAAIIQVSK